MSFQTLSLLSLCLLANILPAQTSPNLDTVIYLSKGYERVSATLDYAYCDHITRLDGGLTFVRRYRADSTLMETGKWLSYNPDSVLKAERVGEHLNYRKTGELWYIEPYLHGKMHGELRSFYPAGQVKRIEQYVEGKSLGGKCYQPDGAEAAFSPFQQPPSFPGGESAMMNYLSSNIMYPKKARRNNIQGKVLLIFVVEKNGDITNVKALKEVPAGCTEEAIRVLSSMPRWEPGLMDGEPVRVRFSLPIGFRLE